MIDNPFAILERRLNRIENLILDLSKPAISDSEGQGGSKVKSRVHKRKSTDSDVSESRNLHNSKEREVANG